MFRLGYVWVYYIILGTWREIFFHESPTRERCTLAYVFYINQVQLVPSRFRFLCIVQFDVSCIFYKSEWSSSLELLKSLKDSKRKISMWIVEATGAEKYLLFVYFITFLFYLYIFLYRKFFNTFIFEKFIFKFFNIFVLLIYLYIFIYFSIKIFLNIFGDTNVDSTWIK